MSNEKSIRGSQELTHFITAANSVKARYKNGISIRAAMERGFSLNEIRKELSEYAFAGIF